MIRSVLFDLDGTLADSLFDLAAATNYAIGKFGFPPREVECFKYFAGDGMPKMIERALPEYNNSAETVAKIMPVFLSYYSKHFCDSTAAYNGMIDLIDELKRRGIKVAVVTNKDENMAYKVVEKLYGKRFDLIIGKREGIPAKPDPAAALIAMRELCVKPDECVFVGDSKMDVKTGVNSGAFPVGVLWGFRKRDELSEGGAKKIISEPKELLDIINGLE
ncbi:MAG: HAD-IA family hydrolase [Clostridia bacterium]|nr:HAD-IA family hydrolase [Clostridia bacterium]